MVVRQARDALAINSGSGLRARLTNLVVVRSDVERRADRVLAAPAFDRRRVWFLALVLDGVGCRAMNSDADASSEDLSANQRSGVSPDVVRSYRYQLTPGEDVIDTATWAGSVPQVNGIAPRVRIGRGRWFNLLWLLPIGFLSLLILVAVAKGLRDDAFMQRFIRRYPGTDVASPPAGTVGFPAWVDVQHFFNLFFMIFIIRAGVQILSDHPRLYWTRHSTPGRDWFRIQRPVPDDPLWTAKQDSISLPGQVGLPGLRHSIGLARWWHLSVDALWLLNGVVFYVLLFATGRWQRLVPTSWDVFPNALSTLVQYLSLNWPAEHGWVAYNGLQLIAYFVTVFIAAPLALITGLGMSPALSTRFKRISKVFSIQTARSLHFLVLVWFLIFIVLHVTFVFTTGLLVNLNHIYAGRTDDSWIGFGVFAASTVVVDRRVGGRDAVHDPPSPRGAARRPGHRRTAAAPVRACRP